MIKKQTKKTLNKVGLEGTYLNIIEATEGITHSYYHPQWGTNGSLSSMVRNKKRMSTLNTVI